MSDGLRPIRSPMKKPLLRIDRCDSEAAFGIDVVPDVNWMLTISSGWSSGSGLILWRMLLEDRRSAKAVVALSCETSMRDEELSTRIKLRRDGTDSDSSFLVVRSGIICSNKVMFSRGVLYGRLVSVPIIK